MKPPLKSFADLKPAGGRGKAAPQNTTFERPTPKVSRQKPGKVLTAAEKAAFLASRPDLAGKG
ncbi:MAG: hypothetical protein U1E50_12315 [Caulobacteraceae bacterium]